jgi:biopolymer transport protein ExbB
MGDIGTFLDKGGWMMYVILGVSIVGVAVFMERAYHLYMRMRLNASGFIATVLGHVEARRYRKAIDGCKIDSAHPLVSVLRAGVMRANRREREIERAMEKEMLDGLPVLGKRVGLLGFLANSCTLLGLLGTIFGLIAAFSSVSAASAAERQSALADGISQAMYTTAFGIVVAVPLLFFHHLLSERQEDIINEMEGGATSLLVSLCGAEDSDIPAASPSGDGKTSAAA